MTRVLQAFFLLTTTWISQIALGQVPAPAGTPPVAQDTAKIVRILKADRLIFDRRDSATDKVILVGHVEMQQGKTLFYCDSAVKDNITNQVEAFGNIHINDADSVHTYSQYLKFDGNTRIARLLKKVRLTDGKADLTTNELEYDLNAKVGTYLNGGKVVNKSSVLTSKEGYYYADTREVFFKQDVKLTDPEYTMATDTLLYNIDQELATFLAATTINDGKSTIRTRSGYYDLKNGNASFGNRPIIEDSTQQIIAESIQYDKKSGEGLAEGNVVYRDTANGATILAGYSRFNSNTKDVLATKNPLMILKQNDDSLFIAADTLLSVIRVKGTEKPDSTLEGPAPTAPDSLAAVGLLDSATVAIQQDSSGVISMQDSVSNKQALTTGVNSAAEDSIALKKSVSMPDSLAQARAAALPDSVRLFHAFHHVRIFSDSLQGVCDSLSYSSADSVFRLYRDPVLWATDAQISGDTIYLLTKNKKADEVWVFENGFSISRTPESFFNQIKGNRINGYFKEGSIDHIRAKGNAESVYYLQDDDSAYVGMNYARADAIGLYFVERELKKVTWVNGVEGTTYPFQQIPEDKKELRNFKWQESRRPKSRYELFGQ